MDRDFNRVVFQSVVVNTKVWRELHVFHAYDSRVVGRGRMNDIMLVGSLRRPVAKSSILAIDGRAAHFLAVIRTIVELRRVSGSIGARGAFASRVDGRETPSQMAVRRHVSRRMKVWSV